MLMQSAVCGFIVTIFAAVRVNCEKTAGIKEQCQTTYNIREYHVHTDRSINSDSTGSTSTEVPLLGSALTAGVFISKNQLYIEKNKWLKKVQELQMELVEEKNKRIAQLDKFLAQSSADSESSEEAANNITGEMRVDMQEDQPFWKLPPDRGENTVIKTDMKGEHRKTTTTTTSSAPPTNVISKGNSARHRSRIGMLTHRVKIMTNTVSRLRKDVRDVRTRSRRLEKISKEMLAGYGRLRKDYIHAQDRNRRLRTYHASELVKLQSQVNNETRQLRADMTSLMTRLVCLESGTCAGAKRSEKESEKLKEDVGEQPKEFERKVVKSAVPRRVNNITNAETTQNVNSHRVYRVLAKTNEQLEFLKSLRATPFKANFWTRTDSPAIPRHIDLQVSPLQSEALVRKLQQHGIQYRVMIEDLQRLISSQKEENIRAKSRKTGRWHDFKSYLDWEEMEQWLVDEANACKGHCVLFNIGTSSEGRDLKVLKISADPYGRTNVIRPSIWIDAGIHAREWISHSTALYFIERLLLDYHTDDETRRLVHSYDWYIMPCVNPDGYVHTHTTDRMWRKTRSRQPGVDCIGVDANRNFNYKWMSVGADEDPCSEVYGGPAPMSEPEVRAVSDFIMSRNGSWLLYLSLHSYSQLWMAPWGYTNQLPANYAELGRVGESAIRALYSNYQTTYEYGTAANVLYRSSGSSRDWAKGVPKIRYVYTAELRDTGNHGFMLPGDQIMPTAIETWAAVTAMVRAIETEDGLRKQTLHGDRTRQFGRH